MSRITRAPSTAAARAFSTSVLSALGTVSTSDPSNGLLTSIRSGLSTQLPATNIFIVVLRRKYESQTTAKVFYRQGAETRREDCRLEGQIGGASDCRMALSCTRVGSGHLN